jgi:FYVE, RhoGEF and PH domain containing 5/6
MLAQPVSSSRFTAFIQAQQLDPRCMKLTLRDWLLTIVQRCPRYLLLLRDLIACTEEDDPEYARLNEVHILVSKSSLSFHAYYFLYASHTPSLLVTLSLNTSLATHTLTLSLLSLQRRTANLPPSLQFVVPGRILEKWGEMIMVTSEASGRGRGRRREMLLFSDCLVWLERVGTVDCDVIIAAKRPPIVRTRSKSEAELSKMSPTKAGAVARHSVVPRVGSTGDESAERWEYKGSAHLVDLEVVIPTHVEGADAEEERKRLEVLNPEGSFVLYTGEPKEKRL